MIYRVRTNKKVKNIRVYTIKNRIGEKESPITKFFIKLFGQQKKTSDQSAIERLG